MTERDDQLRADDPDLLDNVIGDVVQGNAVPEDLRVEAIALVTSRINNAPDDLARARLQRQMRALRRAGGAS